MNPYVGQLPQSLGNLTALEYLSLSGHQLTGRCVRPRHWSLTHEAAKGPLLNHIPVYCAVTITVRLLSGSPLQTPYYHYCDVPTASYTA